MEDTRRAVILFLSGVGLSWATLCCAFDTLAFMERNTNGVIRKCLWLLSVFLPSNICGQYNEDISQ